MTPIEGWTEVAASTMTVTSRDFIPILVATISSLSSQSSMLVLR